VRERLNCLLLLLGYGENPNYLLPVLEYGVKPEEFSAVARIYGENTNYPLLLLDTGDE
jgi:hypothetical protein